MKKRPAWPRFACLPDYYYSADCPVDWNAPKKKAERLLLFQNNQLSPHLWRMEYAVVFEDARLICHERVSCILSSR